MKSTEPVYLQYLFAKARERRFPLSGTFEITSRCNLNCKMCYIHASDCEKAKKEELPAESWMRIADELFDSGVLMMLITGGEPLIRPDFKEIFVYLKKKGFNVSVNTNATLINDEIIELFKEYPPSRIAVSIYGASPETYEKVTGSVDAYQKAINGALKLKAAGIQVKISLTVTQFNAQDIPAIYKWAKENDFAVQATTYMFPPTRTDRAAARSTPEQAAENLVMCEKCRYDGTEYIARARGIANGKRPDDPFDAATDDIGEHLQCRAGSAAFWITCKGELTPCGMMAEPKISLLDTSFKDAWKIISDKAAELTLPPECRDCSYRFVCDVCAASCLAETGSTSKVPGYQCKKAAEFYRLTKEAADGIQNN